MNKKPDRKRDKERLFNILQSEGLLERYKNGHKKYMRDRLFKRLLKWKYE